MTTDRSAAITPARLTAETAFVVHLAPTSLEAPDRALGRVEHVASGEAQRFATIAELIAFMRNTLEKNGRSAEGLNDGITRF